MNDYNLNGNSRHIDFILAKLGKGIVIESFNAPDGEKDINVRVSANQERILREMCEEFGVGIQLV